jgi:SAM-dependent methyltransferase
MADRDHYLMGHSVAENERLRQQGEQLAADSSWLLDQIGIQPGWRAIDVGCGPRGILDLLAERVGPQGRVVGLERDPATVALGQEFVAERGLASVEIIPGDARATGLPRASFDLVHMRLVLVNVPEPDNIVTELVALARPGGIVAVHEVDWIAIAHVCEPPLPAWTRLMSAFAANASARGIDLSIGRKVPVLLRRAGLLDIRVNPIVHERPLGHPRRPHFLQVIENVRERIVSAGLLRQGELDDLLETACAHLDDPETLVISPLFVQAWGRKPL